MTSAARRQLQWIVDAYTLVFAGLLLTAGVVRRPARPEGHAHRRAPRSSARLGRRRYRPRAGQLIAARAVMGLGAAFVMPATLSILTNVFTDPGAGQGHRALVGGGRPRHRPRADRPAASCSPTSRGARSSWSTSRSWPWPLMLGVRSCPTSRDPSTSGSTSAGPCCRWSASACWCGRSSRRRRRLDRSDSSVGAFVAALAVLTVFVLRAARQRTDARHAVLPQRPLHRRQRLDHVHVLRPDRLHLRRGPVPAERAGLHRAGGRGAHAAVRRRCDGAAPSWRRWPPACSVPRWWWPGGSACSPGAVAGGYSTLDVDTGYSTVFLVMALMGAGLGLPWRRPPRA